MAELKAGVAKVTITPPVGIPILGHLYPDRISHGIHDDIWAKVLVLEQNSLQVAIVAMDLCWPMPENDYVKIRDAIEQATGIEAKNIMVSSTHNHQGPVFDPHPIFNMPLPKQRKIIRPWTDSLPARVAEAAVRAKSQMKSARVSFGTTPITGLAYNRRKHIPEGVASLINVDSKHNKFYFGDTPDMPDCIRQQYISWGMPPEEAYQKAPLGLPDGPIDPDLNVIHITDSDGNTIATVVNYACHAVSCSPPVPNLISAGFPGFMASLVEEDKGGVCLFFYGAGADIRPYRSSAKGFEEAQRVGFVLATGVVKAIRESEQIDNPTLKVQSQIAQVPLKEYPPREESEKLIEKMTKELEKAKAEGKYSEAKKLYDEIEAARYPLLLGEWDGREKWINQKGNAPLEVQAIALGDALILSLPNEVDVSVGMEIKQNLWTNKVLLATLTNGCWMYLIKKHEYEEGGYEAAGARLAPGAGEQMLQTAKQVADDLKK